MDNVILMRDEDGNEIRLYVLEETKQNGMNYILATDAEEDEDGDCYILKDISRAEDPEAVYEFVDDDDELEYMSKIFAELIDDTDTEITF